MAKKGKQSCAWTPYVDGKPSKLYHDLGKMLGDRPLTNYIYASYLQPGVSAQMQNLGMKNTDKLGEHFASDVIKVFDVTTMQNEAVADITRISQAMGAIDSLGHLIDYDDATKAVEIANRINENHKGLVAYTTQHSDKFNINVVPRDARTHMRIETEKAKKDIWDILKSTLTTIGIDLDNSNLDVEMANATRGEAFAHWMKNIRNVENRVLALKDIRGLLAMNENTQQVQRLTAMFGTMDLAAQKAYDAYRIRGSVTPAQFSLIDSTLNNSKLFNGLDIDGIMQMIEDVNQSTQASEESAIQATIDDLHQKYSINNEHHDRLNEQITSLSEAADEALLTLNRQYQQTKAQKGEFADETKNLRRVTNILGKEIASKRYYAGILGFMQEANNQVQNVINALQAPAQGVTEIEVLADRSRKVLEFRNICSGYYHILEALTNIDGLIVDEIISTADKQAIAQLAEDLIKLLDEHKKYVYGDSTTIGVDQGIMIDTCKLVLGDRLSNGMATAQYVATAQLDSNLGDRWLYSIGRMSNPMLATMGTIIQDARHEYDTKVRDYSLRIRRANHALRKAGFRSDFMYEEYTTSKGKKSYRIISDIDWNAYNDQYNGERSAAVRSGLKGIALDEHMTDWVEQNTMDRDGVRIPNDNYRKAFPTLDPAQQAYYDEMMDIKKELDNLLPSYARRRYVPPQVRRSFLEAMGAAIKGKDGNIFNAVVKAVLNKIKNIWTIREDDVEYVANGLVNGEEFGITSGTLANTPFKQVPIYYMNPIKDQDELIKDFSGAMQHLVQTALHFEAMNKIQDLIEFMGEYMINKVKPAATGKNGEKLGEMWQDRAITVFKQLWKFGRNTNTEAIIKGMIDYHLYGIHLKDYNKWTKTLKSLLMYNSMRNLTVNLKGAISNYTVGVLQMIIEAGGGEFYNYRDLAWAYLKVLGDNSIGSPGRLWDYLTNNVNSKMVLLGQRFDPLIRTSEEEGRKRYFGPLRTLLSTDLKFIGYGSGEHMIHFINMYAILKHRKVHLNGKTVSLYSIFRVGNKSEGNSELLWDKNATYTDDNGNEVPVDEAFLDKVKDEIKAVNQNTHGSMNTLDKGLIHQTMAGRFTMNLRQWMVEHYSRRYRKGHWDANLKREYEGFWTTCLRLLNTVRTDIFNIENEAALHWNELSPHQKANVKRARAEIMVLALLYGLQFGLGAPEDHKKEFWYRMWIYQVKRAIVDVQGSIPLGIPTELNTLINSPFSATNTVNALLYPVMGIGDVFKEVGSGKHKGENKYLRNLEKHWVPFYKHIEQYMEMGEDEGVFAVFNKSNL